LHEIFSKPDENFATHHSVGFFTSLRSVQNDSAIGFCIWSVIPSTSEESTANEESPLDLTLFWRCQNVPLLAKERDAAKAAG
jgi:hypothetical protein